MKIVHHRVNSISVLRETPPRFGCEIDIRAWGSDLILNHEPFGAGDRLVDYLAEYRHGLLVLNIKEAGIETEVLRLVRQRGVQEYFLLDVEFPYLYQASRRGERAIAVRFSEDEPLELVVQYQDKVDWVWIDTNTRLPVDRSNAPMLSRMKTCLVCPERWGRPEDIVPYQRELRTAGLQVTAVMTSARHASKYEELLG